MPIYYFHLLDDAKRIDTEGTELADLAAARTHAFGVARKLMFKSRGMLDESWASWSMSVRDSDGQELFFFFVFQREKRRERLAIARYETS